MRRSFSWLGVLALACAGCAHFEVQDRFERSFEQTVEGPVSRVDVENSSGDVRIRGVPGAKLTVRGRVTAYASSRDKARELAETIASAPPVERSGDVLSVGRLRVRESGLFQGVSVDYELVVPPELSASIDSSSGDVEVQGIQGAVKVDSSSGDVVLKEIPGDIEVDSSSGDVDIHATPGPQARWKVDASSGDVTVSVAPDAAFHLDAATSSGDVKSDLPIRGRGTVDSDELHGKVGEGPSEAEVKLTTSSGDIHIRQEGSAGSHAPKGAPEAQAGR